MTLTKDEKKQALHDLKDQFGAAKSVVFADYQGLSVKDLKALRTKLRESGVTFSVAKKTLLRLAAKDSGYDEIPDSVMEGPVGAAFGLNDEVIASKLLHEFAKKNKALKLRGSLMGGKIMSAADTKQLALLPSKEELIVKLLYLFKSPITGFHGVLKNTMGGFVRVLGAIKDKQGQTA